jgi:hypothetical protein
LVNHADLEVVIDVDLTRETHVVCEFGLHCQPIALELAHFAGVSSENFDSTRSAASVAAAPMKDVYPSIFENQD